jgi:hypothetical protein
MKLSQSFWITPYTLICLTIWN